MNVRPWRLENYDLRQSGESGAGDPHSDARIEEARLEGFDRGFKAGWEDATQAHQQDQMHVSAELARNLQDMSFTYHEARQAVMRDTETLFRGMVDVFLPKILPAALTTTLVERLLDATAQAGQACVEITIAPENVDRISEMIDGAVAPPLRILPEPSLGVGQAYLKFGDHEERIDLAATLTEIEAIIDDLFAPEPPQQETRDAG